MDIPGEKLVIKMWESLIDKGIGGVLQPWQERRVGESRLELKQKELIKLARAEKMADDIRQGKVNFENLMLENHLEHQNERVEPSINMERLVQDTINTETSERIRKNINVSKSILIAEDILFTETESSSDDEKIDDDWLFNWREYAGRVSSEDLQQLWGKVLAGEIKQPGRYSYRTLSFLKTLSKSDAELITLVAQFVIDGVLMRNHEAIFEKAGVNFSTLMYLQELGILSGVEALGLKSDWKSLDSSKYIKAFVSYNHCVILEHEDMNKIASSSIYLVTSIGKEILSLAQFSAEKEYLESVGKHFVSQGFKVKVADWVQETPVNGRYFNAVEIVV
ncbi:DUF2806 domain-containing protein [Photobacterium piscicola]|uniref:DUF2806 domain-containing protein n=1 Tax=Photobacterium piscicola TaxID=1378299 RepID=UPI002E19A50A|nr:DUF2806 domain-containing protein [Photobacterium piscicola]